MHSALTNSPPRRGSQRRPGTKAVKRHERYPPLVKGTGRNSASRSCAEGPFCGTRCLVATQLATCCCSTKSSRSWCWAVSVARLHARTCAARSTDELHFLLRPPTAYRSSALSPGAVTRASTLERVRGWLAVAVNRSPSKGAGGGPLGRLGAGSADGCWRRRLCPGALGWRSAVESRSNLVTMAPPPRICEAR